MISSLVRDGSCLRSKYSTHLEVLLRERVEAVRELSESLSDGLDDLGRVVVGLSLVHARDLEHLRVHVLERIDPGLEILVFWVSGTR